LEQAVDEDEIEITLRQPAEVAARAIVLASLLRRLALEDVSASDADHARNEAFDLREWLREQGLTAALTPEETVPFDLQVGQLAASARTETSWQAEGLAVLIWALGAGPTPIPGTTAELDRALTNVPAPWDAVRPWIELARLLPESEIAREREVAELWHWRANVEALRRQASTADRRDFEDAIRDVAAEAARAGLLHSTLDGDFALDRSPVRSVSAARLDELLVIATERLRAFNWLAGFGPSWDAVPLEV
jgi:hypothetical protein